MSGDKLPEKLRKQIAEDPLDLAALKDAVEYFLKKHNPAQAAKYFADLEDAINHEDIPVFLDLGLRVGTALDDSLFIARYRKRLRDLEEHNLQPPPGWDDIELDEEDDDADLAHPAQFDFEQLMQPRLRLLAGGADDKGSHLPKYRLSDLAGLATVKRNLEEMLDGVRSPKTSGWLGGALLYGPPNCGKAFLSEVIASELGAVVWTIQLNSEWEARKLRVAIQHAVEDAANNPVLIYLDNVDNEINRRSLEKESVLDVLDSAQKFGQVVILGSATLPWAATPTIVRPGRLGRVLLVLPPDPPARRDFLRRRLEDRPGVSVDEIEWIVKHTDGHSFGDLDALLALASTSDPELGHTALRKARQQVGPSSADWLTTAGHHALMNEAGGLYDDLLQYFRQRERRK